MAREITVVDYGSGNVFSVCRAIEHLGAKAKLITRADEILGASHLIVPGVGAFRNGMDGLRKQNLVEPILAHIHSGRPLLGLCVGMQMLFTKGEEFGSHDGLDVVSGSVSEIPSTQTDGSQLKVPHIGWNSLIHPGGAPTWEHGILRGLRSGQDAVYFVHSFSGHPTRSNETLATTEYGGHLLVAAVAHKNAYGCQFHPERSGPVGLKILSNFLDL